MLPLAKTYYNIIRTEALLETLTQAYETGTLSLTDIAIVEDNSANLSMYGIENPPIPLIVMVYKYVKSRGGPLNFTNEAAVDLAYKIMLKFTPKSAKWMLDVATNVWNKVVAHDGDHRALLKINGCTEKAQIDLWKRMSFLLSRARPLAAVEVADSFAKTPKAKELMEVLATTYALNTSCNPNNLSKSLALGLARYLSLGGMPEELAMSLATNITFSEKNFTQSTAAYIASNYVMSQVPEEERKALGNLSSVLPKLILKLDPEAKGDVNETLAARAATELVLKSLGLQLKPADLRTINDTRSAALYILKLSISKVGRPEAVKLLSLLEEKHLLNAPSSLLREELPEMLSDLAASSMNLSKEDVLPIAKAAVDAYFQNISLDYMTSYLINKGLSEAFPKIINKLKGLFISKDLNGFIISLSMNESIPDEKAVNIVSNISKEISDNLKSLGFSFATATYGGQSVIDYESKFYAEKDIKNIDKFSIVITLIILGLLLESLAATVLPYIGIGLGLVTALAVAYILAKWGIIDVSTESRVIMFTTGLGLGIDYAGYVAKRFREEAERLGPRKAAAEAFRKSWRPVLAGALTASIGFGSMSLAGSFRFITTLGTNIPIAIILVMLASITFIPALLAYVGETRWFWWPTKIEKRTRRRRTSSSERGIGGFLTRKAGAVLVIVVAVAALGAIPVIKFSGSYDPSLELPKVATSYHSLKLMESSYDPGILYPVYIIASNSSSAKVIEKTLSKNQYVSNVEISNEYKGDRVLIVTLSVYPMSKEGTKVANEIRNLVKSVDPNALVGGEPVIYYDIVNLVHKIFYRKVYPVALFLMFLTMWFIYGGLVMALAVIGSVILGAIWGIALTVGIYSKVLGEEVIWFLPILVFTAILGVGMDYNSFFLARAREECEKECSKKAVARSISKSAGLVMGLASAMAGAYIAIAFSSTPSLSQMGVALTTGVLLTGFNASVILTPVLLALLGRRAWWPSKLGRSVESKVG